jgi:general secretion pathway protein M
MTRIEQFETMLARFPVATATLYPVLVVVFISVTAATVIGVLERSDALTAAADLLKQIEARSATPARTVIQTELPGTTGSPFVEGASVSVAGASLLQRLTAATTQVGGNIVSSQIDLQGPQSKGGFVSVKAGLEVEPGALQRLLYDLEAGMPFLFVDQMTVQGAEGSANRTEGKMRVTLSISGQWGGAK